MARWRVIAAAGLLALAVGPIAAQAEETAGGKTPENEAKEDEARKIDQEASMPDGARVVRQRLASEFGVEEARVQGLRDQQLGYGEVHHVLSLAKQMPGGITDENVNKILAMRQEQHMGWGQISKELTGKPLGAVKHAAERPATSVARPGRPITPRSPHGTSATEKTRRAGRTPSWAGSHGGESFGGGMGGGRGRSGSAPGHVR